MRVGCKQNISHLMWKVTKGKLTYISFTGSYWIFKLTISHPTNCEFFSYFSPVPHLLHNFLMKIAIESAMLLSTTQNRKITITEKKKNCLSFFLIRANSIFHSWEGNYQLTNDLSQKKPRMMMNLAYSEWIGKLRPIFLLLLCYRRRAPLHASEGPTSTYN